jgi:hypothetical protein
MGGGRISWIRLTCELGGFDGKSCNYCGICKDGGDKGMDSCFDDGTTGLP